MAVIKYFGGDEVSADARLVNSKLSANGIDEFRVKSFYYGAKAAVMVILYSGVGFWDPIGGFMYEYKDTPMDDILRAVEDIIVGELTKAS